MIGSRISDRYQILSELGHGGIGAVYHAYDPLLDRDVAIKVLTPNLLTAEASQRFQREARVVAKMDHPSIVSVHDIGEHEGSLYLVMPFIHGTNLRSFLKDRSLRLGEVIDMGIQVAEAIEYSHSRGVIHRDIKPENIMIVREESGVRVRVTDFGLSMVSTETRLTQSDPLSGTVAYFSPEQVSGSEIDGRTDVYSLGTVLYECLTGAAPFEGESPSILDRIMHESPQSPRVLGRDVEEELELIVMQCLEKDPGKRPQRAHDVADALARYRLRIHDSVKERRTVRRISRTLEYARPVTSFFVGREKEFGELRQRLNAALANECQFVVVAGEVGIGKTRLLDELETLARARKIPVLHGRFMEQDSAFPYQGFCEAIQEFFRSRALADASSRVDFSDLGPDLASLFPVLAEIEEIRATTLQSGKSFAPLATGRFENRTYLFELLARSLTRMIAGNPTVLLLEDLHAADVSLEALQYVVRRIALTPTLIVATYRTSEVDKRHPLTRMLDSFQGDRRFAMISLQPLSEQEFQSYVEAILSGSNVDPELVGKLYEATEANPFFTRELVRSLIDSGRIVQEESGRWSLSTAAGISFEALPATIQQTVERRIERLPDDLREILSIASVLGRSFEFRDLETLAQGDPSIEESIDRLIAAGFMEEERDSRGDRFAFSSGVVRDVLYSSLSRRQRKSLHRKHAEHLEKRSSGRVERIYAELVHHYAQADVPQKVVDYGLKLARKSLEAFSAEEAVRASRAVLDFLEEGEQNQLLEAEARICLARAFRMAGNIESALKELESAIRTIEKDKQKVVGLILLAAEMAWQGRKVDETKRWVEKGIELARALGEKESLARFLSLGATVANLRGQYDTAKGYLEELEQIQPPAVEKKEITRGGKLVVTMSTAVRAVHPANIRLDEEGEVLANVFETLLTTDTQGGLVPCLCERWETLEKGRSVLLTMRKNIRMQDGRILTSTDVRHSFERAIRLCAGSLPAALAVIRGVSEYLEGSATDVSGIEILSENKIQIHLWSPLPIYPALLTDMRTAIARERSANQFVGTGPFRISAFQTATILLERNPNYWNPSAPLLDFIEFRASLSAAEIAAGLRSGEFDLGHDLVPEDLDEILRYRSLRAGLVEAPKKNLYFVLFNRFGPMRNTPVIPQALCGVVRTHDLVRRTLGRLAQPAEGLLPPGVFGHDPGRRRNPLLAERAAVLLASARRPFPLELKASVHPILQDRYASLTQALFKGWSDLGVKVSIETPDMTTFLNRGHNNEGIDLMIGRWIADYDDPDTFTFGMFHSKMGRFRNYFASAEMDPVLEEARSESNPGAREKLYRKFENHLMESGFFLPLFHDIDYRLANPRVRNLSLRSSPPYVNYAEIGKAEATSTMQGSENRGGVIHAPIAGNISSLDPSVVSLTAQSEVLLNIFENLTRETNEARIAPWLASEFKVEEGGRRFRFKLREDVRFHDGSRLSARDVRYSFERLLANSSSPTRSLLSPVCGAEQILSGAAGDLQGFRILSELEFTMDLVQPLSFFPALLAYSSAAIVPEGADQFHGSWREGCAGTGPFRVARFDPGRRLELEANPYYWRQGYPRCDGLVFTFGVPPDEINREFRAGRFSLAWDLFPSDVDALRHQQEFASRYRETPRLCTYYVVFNLNRGPLADEELRQRLVRSIDVDGLVRRNLGCLGIPAYGLIPPGLLGYEPPRHTAPAPPVKAPPREKIQLKGMMHSVYQGPYAAVAGELLKSLAEAGFEIEIVDTRSEYYDKKVASTTVDFNVTRWIGDYADADTFIHGVLHSQKGHEGRFCSLPEIDRLIERSREETDPTARHNTYRQVEEIIRQRVLLLPLFYEQAYRFARPEVEGLEVKISSPIAAYEKLWVRR